MVYMMKWNGVKIDKDSRARMIQEALDGIMKEESNDYFFIATGNTMALAIRIFDDDREKIELFDLKIRARGSA